MLLSWNSFVSIWGEMEDGERKTYSVNALELTPEHTAVGNGYSEVLVEEGVEPFCGFFPLSGEERGVWVAHNDDCKWFRINSRVVGWEAGPG